ncbi:TrlF family AAA-like ATPase [Sulfurimonas xiamenensis]|jgi:hypothetical protein|uniref:PHP domain-containing protein n=1 Tax=Sulfurimonas xiamenensis TaxID=2590021 RepID=A0AAJ4A3U7_9BACT|nr:PHP domain-containing protein [Sulfurimonas xiamenensis]QFR43398.1 PHP domain-containing protein [Sulfurimonas xiamenensis]
MSAFNRGSEWRKWDLHCHTPLDHEWINKPNLDTVENKKIFAKEYIDFAKAQALSVIAITDHNFCSSIDNLLIPYIQKEASDNGITILPGFEITAKDGSGIHLLVLFKEKTDLSKIHEIVKACFNPGTDLCPSSGVPISDLSISEIKNKVNSSKLDSIFIFAHADSKSGVLDKKTIDGTRRVDEWNNKNVSICQLSKAIDSFNNGTFLDHLSKGNVPLYKRDMTYIIASDCRRIKIENAADGRFYLGQKFVWIKAEPTFEGLKQIIYEPERVRIQEEKPEIKTDYEVIKSIKIIDTTDTFTNEKIGFSNNLNSIIGGKSSGKSLLLYLLAKTVLPIEKYKEIKGYKNFVEYDNLDGIDCEVEWEDGQISKLLSSDNKRYIDYIPQMHLNNIAEDKEKNITFKQTIDELLHRQADYTSSLHNLTSKILEHKQSLNNEIDKYFDNEKELYRLQGELTLLGDKKAIEASIIKYNQELVALKSKSTLTPEDEENIKKIQDSIAENNKEKTIKNNEVILLESIKKVFHMLDSKVITFIDEEFSNVMAIEENKSILEEIKTNLSKNLISSIESFKLDNPLITETLIATISEIDEKINQLTISLEPFNEKFDDKKKFLDTQKKLADEQEKLNKILQKEKEIESQKSTLVLDLFLTKYSELFDTYKKIIELNEPYKLIGKDLELITEIKFDTEKFYLNFSYYIAKNQSLDKIFDPTIYTVKNEFIYKSSDHIRKIKTILIKLFEGSISFNKNKIRKEMITYLFDDYFKITYDLKQGNDRLEHMSPGKKGIILFQLFLEISSSKIPILIDQPEDNLDNRTVYDTLTEFIKNKKIDRQIIMVSHNSNLVVSTDSENIIVANQNGQGESAIKFDYVNGALENTFKNRAESISVLKSQGIREHVCDILEGGEIAFKKREQKYNIK